VSLGLLEGHDLDVQAPAGEVAVGDGVVEVALGVVGVSTLQTSRLARRQTLDALVRLQPCNHDNHLHITMTTWE
jgi:hypothetical protein